MISHNLRAVEGCDRILYIEKGKILESGTHHELMEKDGLYAQLYRLENDPNNLDSEGVEHVLEA